ncbi:hypothetical protein ABPG72_007739 [Tetrahymena utriculariae]
MGQTCTGAKPSADHKKNKQLGNRENQKEGENKYADSDSQKTNSPIIILKKQKPFTEEIITSFEDIRKVYEFEPNILGHGHYGTVRLANHLINKSKKYAVKTISKTKIKKDLHLFRRELEILKSLDHPNVIKFYETYQDKKYFHLVMEYCSGGELLHRIAQDKMASEEKMVKIMKKIFLGVKYLHEKGICHRDLKPENFLFSNNSELSEIKIIDFGLSTYIDEIENEDDNGFFGNDLQTICGTANYLAPEVIKGKYDKRCDIWSLGVLLYFLLCGELPFTGNTNTQIFDKILNQKVEFQGNNWKKVSKEAKDLVKKLLVVNPVDRLTLDQVLKHPWITKLPQKKPFGSDEEDQRILNMLRNHQSTAKFKKEALKILVNFLEEEEIQELKQIFRKIDTNNTGMIKIEELQSALKKVGLNDSEEEVKRIMQTVHIDEKSNQINYSAFVAATLDEKKFFNKERLWNVFKHFDVDDTNYITISNLREALARAGRKIDNQELQEIMSEVDFNLNQRIEWSQFVTIMTQTGNAKTRQHIDRSLSQISNFKENNQESAKNQNEEPNQTGIATSQVTYNQRKSSFEVDEAPKRFSDDLINNSPQQQKQMQINSNKDDKEDEGGATKINQMSHKSEQQPKMQSQLN